MLDRVLTIAIGRDGQNGTLSRGKWLSFRRQCKQIAGKYATVVAFTKGAGIGSDDDRDGVPEDSAVLVCINPVDVDQLRQELAHLLPQYGQSSAAFAVDAAHEPVFATNDGRRITV
jgi:hypothetical protein